MKAPYAPSAVVFDLSKYDRRGKLLGKERAVLDRLRKKATVLHSRMAHFNDVERLMRPLVDFFVLFRVNKTDRLNAIRKIFEQMRTFDKAFWGWSKDEWLQCMATVGRAASKSYEYTILVMAHHFGGLRVTELVDLSGRRFMASTLTPRLWGRTKVDRSFAIVCDELDKLGYTLRGSASPQMSQVRATFSRLMIELYEPDVRMWSEIEFAKVAESSQLKAIGGRKKRPYIFAIWQALFRAGIFRSRPEMESVTRTRQGRQNLALRDSWKGWVDRYSAQRVGEKRTIVRDRSELLAVGNWAAMSCPEAADSPADWTPEIAADYVRHVCKARIGDDHLQVKTAGKRLGQRLQPASIAGKLKSLRGFFFALMDLEWIPRIFNPRIVFRLPTSVARQTGPKPRDLAPDFWAKLRWAGENLVEDDFHPSVRQRYAIEMLRALAELWLSAGLRSDEVRRLRVDCIEWEVSLLEDNGEGVAPSICWLSVPANKYKPEFRKPVPASVGRAVDRWRAVRVEQPEIEDRKTGRLEQKLFMVRGQLIGARIIGTIIHSLCDKAGVPHADSKGTITSHRGRSTIATELANAPLPLTPFELMHWLGHKSIRSTEFYVGQRPRRLAQKIMDAETWRKNVARIGVVFDKEAIESGAAAQSGKYKYYDLGHGYCMDNFFSRCQHRMACVRCSLYLPKDSTKGQLLEAASANELLYEEIPIRDDERLALEGDSRAIKELTDRLRDVPAPDGQTPKQLEADRE